EDLQVAILNDMVPPTITCPSNANVSCEADISPAALGMATATDVVSAASNILISSSDVVAAGSCPANSTITRTWTAVDEAGNSNTCDQVITVVDMSPPMIMCHSNMVVGTDPGLCTAVVVFSPPAASDNCDTNTEVSCSPMPGSPFSLGTTAVECVAIDDCGNMSTCTFDVIVVDAGPPTIMCPPDQSGLSTDPGTNTASVVIPAPVVADVCDADPTFLNNFNGTTNASGDYPVGLTEVIWTAMDASGNVSACTQSINVACAPPILTANNGFSSTQLVVLYQNDFESPTMPPAPTVCTDASLTPVSTLYGPEFLQSNTVETILINGPSNHFADPMGLGGEYSLAMLSVLEDDQLAFTFDSLGLPVMNLEMIISALDLPVVGCGGSPFGAATPIFELSLYDSPGGVFTNFSSPGVLLDQVQVTGTMPGVTDSTLSWSNIINDLDP
ncbi:MAG: HYR domain-containing protein, partial [Verrucomicrobiota bacterium]